MLPPTIEVVRYDYRFRQDGYQTSEKEVKVKVWVDSKAWCTCSYSMYPKCTP
jgi:hypothetical protein